MSDETNTLPADPFEAVIRAVRETIRAEMRAEFEARAQKDRDISILKDVVDVRTALQRSRDYDVPVSVDGVPV